MSTEWNESQTELLKRLWIAGESARTIAEKLGQGITRNAVIGKAHRLGLTGKHSSEDVAPARSAPRSEASKSAIQAQPNPGIDRQSRGKGHGLSFQGNRKPASAGPRRNPAARTAKSRR
jgi:GcrA cell cycle regulator